MNPNTSNTHSHKINKLFSRTSNRSSSSSAASSDHRTTSASKSTWPPSGRRPSSTQEETPEEVAVASSSTDEVNGASGDGVFESPVIVEPPTPQMSALRIGTGAGSTRRHTHTYYDRPYSVVDLPPSSYNSPTAATPRLADFPSRLSGWFSNLAGSSTDLSQLMHQSGQSIPPPTPTALAQNSMSPKHKASGIFTSAARHGKGGLEKAVRYLLDSDAQPDKCTDPIWLMGVCHPGYDPSQQVITPASLPVGTGGGHRRDSTESSFFGRRSSPPTISKGTFHQNPSLQSLSLSLANTPSSSSSGQGGGKQTLSWPPAFYEDFTSSIWMTYRSQYPPIRDISLAALESNPDSPDMSLVSSPPRKNWWPGGGEKCWTSDTGWGCMLRTGQSLLANALIHLHLSRDWRRPLQPSMTEEYATYVKILTWFLDSPSPQCPFGVHRMALAGKDLGKDVGSWFGPSTAAGAIKTLAFAFPECQLAVSVAPDGVVFESDVYAASNWHSLGSSSRRQKWGQKSVLVLVGIRLGIDAVHPVYYEGIKSIFKWPQSVGISGGRPSSSYYFVGEQAGSLFYLDPHHTRVAVPLRSPPTPTSPAMTANSQLESDDVEKEKPREKSIHKLSPSKPKHAMTDRDSLDSFSTSPPKRHESIKLLKHRRVPTSPQRHHQTLHNPRSSGSSTHSNNAPLPPPQLTFSLPPSPPPPNVEPWVYHYATAYSPSELRTFHCDKVRKMPFSALDPSMLLGFLCKDESDWKDLRIRVAELARVSKTIFTIQDEPPSSDPDDLESVSDPDIDLEDDDDESVEVDRYDKHEPDEDEEEDVDKVSDDFYDAEEGNASDGRKRHAAKHQELHHSREGVGEPTTTSRASSLFTGIDDDAKEQKPHVAGDHTDLSAYGEEDDDGSGSESDWVVDSSSAWGPSPSSAPAAVSVPAPPPVTEQPAAAASVSPPLSRSSTFREVLEGALNMIDRHLLKRWEEARKGWEGSAG
ncbi:Cysteine protease atg4 [Tulasnella sp. 418]|nr:Cysteine protease atg4 [Tulasnella sp. 418]